MSSPGDVQVALKIIYVANVVVGRIAASVLPTVSASRPDPKLRIVLAVALCMIASLFAIAVTLIVGSRRVDTSTSPWTKEKLIALFDETIDLVGGGEWSVDPMSGIECTTVSGSAGTQYGLLRIGPGTEDADEAVSKVRALWLKRGITTTRATVDGGTVEMTQQGLDKHRFTVEFDANVNAMILDGQSACLAEQPKGRESQPADTSE